MLGVDRCCKHKTVERDSLTSRTTPHHTLRTLPFLQHCRHLLSNLTTECLCFRNRSVRTQCVMRCRSWCHAVPDVARCLQSAANAEQSAMRSRDCGVYLLLHLSARRACAEMRCRYAAPAHWRSAGGGANCETFRIHSLISKRTIHIPNEGGWTRGQGLSLRRCDCVAFEHRLKSRYTDFRDWSGINVEFTSWRIFLLPSLNCMQFYFQSNFQVCWHIY